MPSDGVRTNSLVNLQPTMYITVAIKASKTDPFRKGVTVHIGATKSQLCPVAAVLACMVQWGSQAGPFFLFDGGRHLMRDHLVAEVRRALEKAGVDPSHYSGHSFRIGAARLPDQDTGEVGERNVHPPSQFQ